MSTNRIVTDQDVAVAAQALTNSGSKVSCRSVRDALGGGSMTDIAPALRKWKAAQAAKEGGPSAEDLPLAVEEAMRQAAADILLVAQQEAEAQIEAMKHKAAEDVATVERERDDLVGELDGLTAELEGVKAANNALSQQLESLRAAQAAAESKAQAAAVELAQGRAEVEAERSRREAAEGRASEQERTAREAIERAARMEGELAALRGQGEGKGGKTR